MKNRISIIALILVTACDTATAPASLKTNAPSLARSEAAWVHSVTGGGQLVGADWAETYGFTVQKDFEGNVKGQVQMAIVDLPGLHGNVTCLEVDGAFAWIGGVVTASQNEAQVPLGTQFWFRVQDNGQGSDLPDRMSSIRLGLAASICAERRPVGVPWQLLHGNIVVR